MKYNQPYGISDPNAVYINGDPSVGRAGSIPPAESIEYPQREVVNVISYSNSHALTDFTGVLCPAPSNTDLLQLLKAIEGLIVSWGARTSISQATTFYVNNSTGNNNNDGLSPSTAWFSISKAVMALSNFTLNGNTATIQLANTGINYVAPAPFAAPSNGMLVIRGDPVSQSSYVIQGTGSGNAGLIQIGGGSVTLVGLTLLNTSNLAATLYVGSLCTVQNITFANAGPMLAPIVAATTGGVISLTTGNIYAGPATVMWQAAGGGQIVMFANQALSGTPNFTIATAVAASCGVIQLSVAGWVFTGSGATGSRYAVSTNGVINTGVAGASFFPGNSVGTTGTGGQYV